MSLSKIALTRPAIRSASTSTQATKAAGDISSVFPSLRPDYKPEALPPHFQELKSKLYQQNETALKRSWDRLLVSLEEEVGKIRKQGSDVSIFLVPLWWGGDSNGVLDNSFCPILRCGLGKAFWR